MSNEDHSLTILLGEPGEQIKNKGGILNIQISCRFIGQDNLRLIGEGAGDSHSLLLAT